MAKDPTAGMTEAQRAYESKRAAKAGMTIEKWMAEKNRAMRAAAKAAAPPPPPKKRGLIGRILDRARGDA